MSKGGSAEPDELALPEDDGAVAEGFDVLELVGHEEDGHALGGEALDGGEELLLLRQADSRGRLVEDEGAGPEPEEPQDLELLPLADRQGVDVALGVEVEVEAGRPARGTPRRPCGGRGAAGLCCRG